VLPRPAKTAHAAELPAAVLLFVERALQLLGREQLVSNENFTQAHVLRARHDHSLRSLAAEDKRPRAFAVAGIGIATVRKSPHAGPPPAEKCIDLKFRCGSAVISGSCVRGSAKRPGKETD
jgi:hypothetical protein